MTPKTKIKIALLAMVLLLALGTIGYKLIAGWPWFECFYFTLITISTIGYGEPAAMTVGTKYFTVCIILLGVGTIGYALTAVASSVLEFELFRTFGKRRMFKDINKLSGHYIVCGGGRMGSRVIREMTRSGVDFVVIENDEARADRMLAQGTLVLMGDATDDDVLRGAGIERARGLVCSVTSDPENLYITLAARDLNKDLHIVARASDETAVPRLLKAGANKVVSPIISGSNQMAQMLLRPAVADFIELATMTDELELEIDQIEIPEWSPFVGRALKNTSIRSDHDVIVIAIKRSSGHMLFNPSADTIIEHGDAFVAMGSHENLEILARMAQAKS